jgi:hypothetical protein
MQVWRLLYWEAGKPTCLWQTSHRQMRASEAIIAELVFCPGPALVEPQYEEGTPEEAE